MKRDICLLLVEKIIMDFFLRCFMPNQQSWMFRWIFSVLCHHWLVRICWRKYVSLSLIVTHSSQFNNVPMTEYRDIKPILTSWMASWMKGTCETRQEYKFLLYLITKYLKPSPVNGDYGIFFSRSFLMFIHKHVIQQEEWYTFYNRTNLHHNKEYSSTPLEGMNNAIKHFSSSTHP